MVLHSTIVTYQSRCTSKKIHQTLSRLKQKQTIINKPSCLFFIPVKSENDSVQMFLFNGMGPPSSVPAVKPMPIIILRTLHVKSRMSRSA